MYWTGLYRFLSVYNVAYDSRLIKIAKTNQNFSFLFLLKNGEYFAVNWIRNLMKKIDLGDENSKIKSLSISVEIINFKNLY